MSIINLYPQFTINNQYIVNSYENLTTTAIIADNRVVLLNYSQIISTLYTRKYKAENGGKDPARTIIKDATKTDAFWKSIILALDLFTNEDVIPASIEQARIECQKILQKNKSSRGATDLLNSTLFISQTKGDYKGYYGSPKLLDRVLLALDPNHAIYISRQVQSLQQMSNDVSSDFTVTATYFKYKIDETMLNSGEVYTNIIDPKHLESLLVNAFGRTLNNVLIRADEFAELSTYVSDKLQTLKFHDFPTPLEHAEKFYYSNFAWDDEKYKCIDWNTGYVAPKLLVEASNVETCRDLDYFGVVIDDLIDLLNHYNHIRESYGFMDQEREDFEQLETVYKDVSQKIRETKIKRFMKRISQDPSLYKLVCKSANGFNQLDKVIKSVEYNTDKFYDIYEHDRHKALCAVENAIIDNFVHSDDPQTQCQIGYPLRDAVESISYDAEIEEYVNNYVDNIAEHVINDVFM
jgi:hypothetical protein